MPDQLPFERPLGARPAGDGETMFRVWAPHAQRVAVRVRGAEHELADEGLGVRAGTVAAGHGDDYELVLDGTPLPDPASRWQPYGLRGSSRIVDPRRFVWTDGDHATTPLRDAVIYELHVGTFSREGTFDAAISHLPALADLGVTTIELMPVAEFPVALLERA